MLSDVLEKPTDQDMELNTDCIIFGITYIEEDYSGDQFIDFEGSQKSTMQIHYTDYTDSNLSVKFVEIYHESRDANCHVSICELERLSCFLKPRIFCKVSYDGKLECMIFYYWMEVRKIKVSISNISLLQYRHGLFVHVESVRGGQVPRLDELPQLPFILPEETDIPRGCDRAAVLLLRAINWKFLRRGIS